MHAVRGRLDDIDADRDVADALPDLVAESGVPAFRAWTPPRQVAFGRRDAAADGYDRAREAARERGYEPIERQVGGRAVAYTGSVLAFSHVVPNEEGDSIQARYERTTDLLEQALARLGATVDPGEPEAAFCPGDHSLQCDGKMAGIAQRVRRDTAVVGGCLVVSTGDERAIGGVLDPVYDALGVPFDPESVGSVESAGGPDDTDAVVEALEAAFAAGGSIERVDARELL
ncbi:lipoate--protein ligase family protein [Natronomonas amylolytica]|uniref:lipoate--protein ligase family protein n=1 Tax=Natronomonas amylolytica TaxID=3108498 RepID=UPI00300BC5F1